MKSCKTLSAIALFGALSIVFMGCPYESKIPLDTADKGKVDKRLEGEWSEKDSEDYTWKCEVEGNQYRVTKRSIEDKEAEPTIYIGWLSDVGEAKFLNLYEQGSDEKSYMLYRMDMKGEERVKFKAVTDNITDEFTSSEELKSFVKKNMELTFFYNKDDEKTFYKEDK
jgi:hypothetical protein